MTGRYWTIAEAAEAIAARRLSPVELVDDCVARISEEEPHIRSFALLLADEARRQAREAEREIVRNGPAGPLHGIPVGLKDVIETRGVPTKAGSKTRASHIPEADAVCARRLSQAGTILLGKLTTHEFAMGGPSFDLPVPPARNPWNVALYTGGSSSGPGAAVAAGFVLGAVGTDTGGSIRLPSSLCGLAGLKPTYGLVDRAGVIPLAYSLDHVGPMAWTSRDCALMLDAIRERPRSAGALELMDGDLRGMRIGVLTDTFDELPVGPDVAGAIAKAREVLGRLGAELVEARIAKLADYHAAATIIMLAEAFSIYGQELRDNREDFGASFRHRVMPGALIAASDYVSATRWRRKLTSDMEQALETCHALLLPTTGATAGPIENVTPTAFFERPSFTAPANVTGLPALNVCCGFDPNGLPIGMQLIGRRFDEMRLLKIGDAYERATAWRGRRPKPGSKVITAPC